MIGLDVISGFLGAGKTTLANALLAHYLKAGERAVYIVNELGETDTDAELIRSEGFTAMELVGGCVCCTLRTNLLQALPEVIKTFKPTKIVFETSGIFIYDQFESVLQDEFLRTRCRVERTVAVVDSLNVQRRTQLAGNFIENQMKNASVIVLSKLERFGGDLDELLCDVKTITPGVPIIARRWDEAGFLGDFLAASGDHVWVSGHGHAHLDAVTLEMGDGLTRTAYERFVEALLSGEHGELLRVKGALVIDGEAQHLDIAGSDVVLKPARPQERTRLTFIGHGFTEASLRGLLSS
jgi:G3E family GTPase